MGGDEDDDFYKLITKRDLRKSILSDLFPMEWTWNYEKTAKSRLYVCYDSDY